MEYFKNRDPEFIEFQKKQKTLIATINTMESFPDNLTKDQYLIKELEKLKSEVYLK